MIPLRRRTVLRKIARRVLPAALRGGVGAGLQHARETRRIHGGTLSVPNVRRLANNLAVEFADRRQVTLALCKPQHAIFELTNHCNLRCPLCNTGGLREEFDHIERGMMSYETFVTGLNKLLPQLQEVLLYTWGEPFLNKDVFRCIEYARAQDLLVQISSNMILCDEEKSRRMIEAGLSRLIVSCDGLTQETYEAYRVRGDLARLIRNVDALVALKRRLGVRHPEITLQFIVFSHNEHEIEEFEQFWMARGADRVDFIRMSYMSKQGEDVARKRGMVPRDERYQPFHPYGQLKRCSDPYRHVSIDWNGDWYTCCFTPGERDYKFGNILKDSFWSVWNGPKYRYSRELIRTQQSCSDGPSTMCHDCTGVFPSPESKRYWNVAGGGGGCSTSRTGPRPLPVLKATGG
jgi:radical SAM protein with 4Fe4S-binding SPASM domain